MSFFKNLLGGAKGALFGTGYNRGRWQRGIDQQFIAGLTREDQKLLKGLRGDLEAWYQNPYLKELISPAYASRAVAAAQEGVQAGVADTKRKIGEVAGRGNLGKAFAANQGLVADVAGSAAVAQVRRQQEVQRQVVGSQREQGYRQGKANLKELDRNLAANRLAVEHGSLSQYNDWRGQRIKEQFGNTLGTAMAAIGGAAGGGFPGAFAGMMAGRSLGRGDIQGAYSPVKDFAAIFSNGGGQKVPESTGSSPLLAMFSQFMGMFGGAK